MAGGYSSGELRIFNYITKEVVATFRGHRSAVSAVAFERSGSIVASGGRDSDIFLWDLVTLTGEIGLLISIGWTAHVDDSTLQKQYQPIQKQTHAILDVIFPVTK